jgi:glycosyltransferase involved in cell wall biosynthesis
MKERRTDILCLCTRHALGGTIVNADLLTAAFRTRGYIAELGFLYEKEPNFRRHIDDYFVVYHKEPKTPQEWLSFLLACGKQISARRPRATLAFQPFANVMGALMAGWQGNFVTSQAWPASEQSKSTEKAESCLIKTPLVFANIACSKFVASSYPHRGSVYQKKTTVIYNAAPQLPNVPEDATACRALLGIREARPILGAMGRLHEQKNFQLIIRALPYIPNAHLYIVGDGSQEQMLRTLAGSLGVGTRTHFLGSITGADVTRFLKAVDLLLMPSIYEGHPLVMLEAMSVGVPVLAHDIPVMREAGADAVLYASSNPEDWAKKISAFNSVASARLKRAGMIQAARHTSTSMVDQYLEVMGLPPFKS